MDEKAQLFKELLMAVDILEVDERRVLLAIAKRLALGYKQYGALDLETDPRDWLKEASEELFDGCVYLACESLRRTR